MKNKTTKVLNSLAELEESPQWEEALTEKYGNLKDKRREVDLINAKVSGKINTDIDTMKLFRLRKTHLIVAAGANKFLQTEYPSVESCIEALNALNNGNDIQRKIYHYIDENFGESTLKKYFHLSREEMATMAERIEKEFEEFKKSVKYPMWEAAYATMQKHKHIHESLELFCEKIQKKTISLKVYEEYEILKSVWMNFLTVEGYVIASDWKGSISSLIAKFVNSLKKRISK